MILGNESPTPAEIRDQLDLMLGSKRFRNAPNQSAFLKLVVGRALEGEKTTGGVIAQALFRDKCSDGVSKKFDLAAGLLHVRPAARNLRSTLTRYYAKEGHEDLVVISLPKPSDDDTIKPAKGEAYTPQFSYNSAHAIGKDFKLLQYYLARGTYHDYIRASKHFHRIRETSPTHIGASIAAAEVYCGFLYWDADLYPDGGTSKEQALHAAATCLDRVHQRASEFWHLHAAGGYMLMSKGDLQQAQQAFEDALLHDRASTEEYPPYFEFLARSGDKAEAIRLARRYLELHIDDIFAHAHLARILLLAEEFESAHATLENANRMDNRCYAVHLLFARLWVAQRNPFAALNHIKIMKTLVDESTCFFALAGLERSIDVWPNKLKLEWLLWLHNFRLDRLKREHLRELGLTHEIRLSRPKSFFERLAELPDRWLVWLAWLECGVGLGVDKFEKWVSRLRLLNKGRS